MVGKNAGAAKINKPQRFFVTLGKGGDYFRAVCS